MKFLLIVLVIHLLIELIGHKKRNKKEYEAMEMDETIRHPAEYDLR